MEIAGSCFSSKDEIGSSILRGANEGKELVMLLKLASDKEEVSMEWYRVEETR